MLAVGNTTILDLYNVDNKVPMTYIYPSSQPNLSALTQDPVCLSDGILWMSYVYI